MRPQPFSNKCLLQFFVFIYLMLTISMRCQIVEAVIVTRIKLYFWDSWKMQQFIQRNILNHFEAVEAAQCRKRLKKFNKRNEKKGQNQNQILKNHSSFTHSNTCASLHWKNSMFHVDAKIRLLKKHCEPYLRLWK